MRTPLRVLRQAYRYVQDVTGESDYDRYLEHHRLSNCDSEPLPIKAWFAQRTMERYADGPIRRCC
jgi:uncharacterized short protein YbdD (DUF466 family)